MVFGVENFHKIDFKKVYIETEGNVSDNFQKQENALG